MFDKSTRSKQVCQLLLSLIVAQGTVTAVRKMCCLRPVGELSRDQNYRK